MTQIKQSDFTDDGGFVDREGFWEARKKNGELCQTCEKQVVPHRGAPVECSDCVEAKSSAGIIQHTELVRCPKCGHLFEPAEADQYDLFDHGQHIGWCPECEHEFEVKTDVSYIFTSPRREVG